MSSDDEQYAVIVTRPDGPDRPDGADLSVRIGPYPTRHAAERVVGHLAATVQQRSWRISARIGVALHDDTVPHRDPLPRGVDVINVVASVLADRAVMRGSNEWAFPDTFDILYATHGHDEATRVIEAASAELDAIDAMGAAEQDEAAADRIDQAEQVAAAEAAAYVYRDFRDAAATAARRRVAPVTGRTLTAAADLLADLVTAADRHPVDRADMIGALAPVAVDVAADAAARRTVRATT